MLNISLNTPNIMLSSDLDSITIMTDADFVDVVFVPTNSTTARKMLNSGDPVDITAWKLYGSIVHYKLCKSLRYDFYGGWRNVKILSSGEFRRIRDCLIFRVNDCEVFL